MMYYIRHNHTTEKTTIQQQLIFPLRYETESEVTTTIYCNLY